MLLASSISEKQDTEAYLRVLAMALRAYGVTSAIVTDSGGIFYSLKALAIYEALDIQISTFRAVCIRESEVRSQKIIRVGVKRMSSGL